MSQPAKYCEGILGKKECCREYKVYCIILKVMNLCLVHQMGHDVNGDREHDCAVVLSGDAVQCLEISQLEDNITICSNCIHLKCKHLK